MKKMIRKMATFVVMAAIAVAMTTTVFAAGSKKPFKDVTVKTVGKSAYIAVVDVKNHHGFDGVFEGKRLKPQKMILRRQFLAILKNYYGAKNVPVTKTDKRRYNEPITARWAAAKLVAVAKKLGVSIKWNEKSAKKLTRAGACQYIKKFSDFDDGEVFEPLR